jgi:hypothetical protein
MFAAQIVLFHAIVFQHNKSTVLRRYNDFVAFQEVLLLRFPYRMVPALPPKKLMGGMDLSCFLTLLVALDQSIHQDQSINQSINQYLSANINYRDNLNSRVSSLSTSSDSGYLIG